jgi:excisionase family DNA binding protein
MNKHLDHERYLTPTEVAKMLNVSPITVRQWAQKGMIKAEVTPGGHRRFKLEEVLKLSGQSSNQPENGPLRVLIIDDDQDIAELIEEQLATLEGAVITSVANSGFQAGEKVRGFLPDVILLDFKMPGINGDVVCSQIKSIEGMSKVRIIAMSGYFTETTKNKMLSSGAETTMTKPIDMDKLFSILGLSEKNQSDEINPTSL